MRVPLPLLVVSHLLVGGAAYLYAPTQPVDTEAKHTGYFQVDTTRVLATTVESLREENKLLVFSYKGSAKVTTERTRFWVFGGRQELIVPAVVNYYLDLSQLTLADARYDERAKLVTVQLPGIEVGDIAFQPENATAVNGGLLTFSETQVEELRKANYTGARRAMVAQAQGKGLLAAARRKAQANVTDYFEIPLRISGHPDIKVVTTFR